MGMYDFAFNLLNCSVINEALESFLYPLVLGIVFTMQEKSTVPLVMPLLMLLERQSAIFEGMDWWENHDRGCEIMFSHLETGRFIAQNAALYQKNAQQALEGKRKRPRPLVPDHTFQ